MIARDVLDYVFEGKLIEKLAEHRHLHTDLRSYEILVNRHRIGEQARILSHECFKKHSHPAILQVDVIQFIAIHHDLDLGGYVNIFRESPVACPFYI